MSRKTLIWIGMTAGSTIGAYAPLLWGASALSFSSIVLSAVGGITGIYLGFKASDFF
jgi:hypothetical protein